MRNALENYWPHSRAVVYETEKWLLSRVKKDNILFVELIDLSGWLIWLIVWLIWLIVWLISVGSGSAECYNKKRSIGGTCKPSGVVATGGSVAGLGLPGNYDYQNIKSPGNFLKGTTKTKNS